MKNEQFEMPYGRKLRIVLTNTFLAKLKKCHDWDKLFLRKPNKSYSINKETLPREPDRTCFNSQEEIEAGCFKEENFDQRKHNVTPKKCFGLLV